MFNNKLKFFIAATAAIFIFAYVNNLQLTTFSLPLFLIAGYLISKDDYLIMRCAASGIGILAISIISYTVFVHMTITPIFNIHYILNVIIVGFYFMISAITALIIRVFYASDTHQPDILDGKKKLFYYSIVLIIFLSFLQSFMIFKGSYYDHTDSGLVGYPIHGALSLSSSMWNPMYYTGSMAASISSTPGLLIEMLQMLFALIFGNILGAELFFGLLILAGGLGIFLIVYELTSKSSTSTRCIAGIASFIIFSYYFYPQYGATHALYQAFLPITIFFLFKLYQSVEADAVTPLSIILPTISLATLIGVGEAGYLLPNGVMVGTFLITFIAFSKNKMALFKCSMFVILISLLINGTIFISLFTYIHNNYQGYFNSFSYNILLNTSKENILVPFEIYGVTAPSLMLQYSGNGIAAMLAETIILLIGFAAVYFSAKLRRETQIFIIWLFIVVISLVFFYGNLSAPFGDIFSFILNHFSLLLADRAPDPIFYYSMFFAESVLFSVGAVCIGESLKGRKRLAFLALMIVILAVRLYYFDGIPLVSVSGIQIPNYYYQVANYINNRSSGFNTALLPAEYPFGHFANFYYGTDIYSYLINGSVFTGGYTATSMSQLGPSASTEAYYNISNSIQEGNIQNKSYIATKLGNFGIRYIVVQGDSAPNGTANGYLDYNYSYIYANLNSSNNISYAAHYGNASIYENNKALPLVFSGNNNSVSFNIISYTEISANLHNASSVYLRQTYDPDWVASYQNGTVISDHRVGFGYMNEWVIAPSATTIIISYTPEKYAYLGLFISIASIFCLALPYLVIKRRTVGKDNASSAPAAAASNSLQTKKITLRDIVLDPFILSSLIVVISLFIMASGISMLMGNVVNTTVFNGRAGYLIFHNNNLGYIYAINYTLPSKVVPKYENEKGIIFFYQNTTELSACRTSIKNMSYLLYNLRMQSNTTINVSYSYVNPGLVHFCNSTVYIPPQLH